MRGSQRIKVFEVSSREHGVCVLPNLTQALHHVKCCVKVEGSKTVKLRERWMTKAAWDELPDTCEYGK